MNSLNWFTGSGNSIDYGDIFNIIDSHISDGGEIFIGTDSQLVGNRCVFASAICLHNKNTRNGGKYFFSRRSIVEKDLKFLKLRIMKEVNSSIDIAMTVLDKFPHANIEVHLDIGMSERSKTREYAEELMGWTKAVGFDCKIKPDSWASYAIADKHTK